MIVWGSGRPMVSNTEERSCTYMIVWGSGRPVVSNTEETLKSRHPLGHAQLKFQGMTLTMVYTWISHVQWNPSNPDTIGPEGLKVHKHGT